MPVGDPVMFSGRLKLGPALTLSQNPNFEMASSVFGSAVSRVIQDIVNLLKK
jgi:hypothetical protein